MENGWGYAICVQSVYGTHTKYQDISTLEIVDEEWEFNTKWQAVCLQEWGAYFVNKTILIGEA